MRKEKLYFNRRKNRRKRKFNFLVLEKIGICDVDNNYISYLALEEGKIIGFMSLVKKLISERMILDLIQVDKNFRGQGIGRILWEKAVEEAGYGASIKGTAGKKESEKAGKQTRYIL